ncbi:g1292 [Coccomyxa elongata]
MESKRAKGLRSPRSSKRPLTPDHDVKNVSYGDPTAQGLSQLSDLVSLETQPQPASVSASVASLAAGEGASLPVMSQDLMAPPELPSQPDIPPPELLSPALLYTHAPNGAAPPQESPSLGGALGTFGVQYPGLLDQPAAAPRQTQEQVDHAHGDTAAQRSSKGTRRGPMDEMRQLVRILVKIIPHSVGFLASPEEGGGGNRISEERIKFFLDSTLGEAPRPTWGVPGGWGEYLSELFSWVLERAVTKEQAMRCAKREPGRSWEAIGSELRRLGIHSSTWPLPLTREGLRKAATDPIPQPMPNASKRTPEDIKGPASKRRTVAPAGADTDSMGEVEIWQQILRLLHAARKKLGTAETGAGNLGQVRRDSQALMNELCAASSMGPLHGAFALPVLLQGANGQFQVMHQLAVGTAASQQQQQQQPGWPVVPSASNTQGLSQLASPPLNMMMQQSVSQLSGLSPSQLLLSQPLVAGSAFQPISQPLRATQSQQPSTPAAQTASMETDARAYEVTKPQAIRLQPGNPAAAHDEPMETEPISSGPLSNTQDMSFPSTQDSERIYERLNVTLPEANSDMDIHWPESSQKGSKGSVAVIRPQPMKPDQPLEGDPDEASHMSFRPIQSSSSIVPFRKSDTPSSSLIPVSGALTGPYVPASSAVLFQPSGLQSAGQDVSTPRLQYASTGTLPALAAIGVPVGQPAQKSRFAQEQPADVAVSSPAVSWAPSLSAVLR